MFAKSFSAFFTLVLLCGSGLFVLAANELPAPPQGCTEASTEKITEKTVKSTLRCGTPGLNDVKLASSGNSNTILDVCRQYNNAQPQCYNPANYDLINRADCQSLIEDFRGNANADGSFNTNPGESTKYLHGKCVFYFVNRSGNTLSFCYDNMLDAVQTFGASGRCSVGGAAQGNGWYISVVAK